MSLDAAQLLSAFPGAFYVTDLEGRLTGANPRFATLAKGAVEPLVGQPLEAVLPPEMVDATLEHERQVASIAMPVTRELEVAGRRGSTRTWLVTKFPLLDDAGAPTGVGTLVVDVTQQVRGRAAAQREAAFVRQIFDMVPNLIYAKDRSGRFTLANRAIAELLGTTPTEALGRTEAELGVSAECREAVAQGDRAVLDGGRDTVVPEEPRRDGQGVPRWFRTSRHPLQVSDGSTAQMLGVATEITEYRNAQRARLKLKDERMEAIGRLAGGIAHDFNNLLTVLRAGADVLQEAYGDDEQLGFVVKDITYASDRAAKLTQHLLAYSRRQLLTPQRVDLDVAITEAAGVLRRMLGEGRRLELELGGSLPAVLVDRASLEQILVNYASNARDAMPDGGTLHLRTRLRSGRLPGAEHEGIVELVAEDTGEGIAPDALDHVFEPFFTTKAEGQGTGLGLSTVYGIVRQSGGEVEARNAEGGGACFIIRFPATTGPAAKAASVVSTTKEGRGERILVIDDEATIRRVVRRILGRQGYRVEVADSLPEAEEIVQFHEGKIDLMLVDIVMPRTNGFEVAAALRPLLPGAGLLHMTGHTKDTLPVSGGLEEGYLQKPFTRDQLLQRVRAVLDEQSVRT